MVFLAFAAFRRPRQSYLLAAAGSAAGSFLNPYGWHLHGHIARYLSNQELLRRIAEFQTFNFQTEGAGQVLAALCFTGIGAVLAATQRRWHHAALLAMFFLIGIRSARGLPLLAMAALPMAGGAVTRALPWSKFVSYSEKLRAIDRKLPSWPAIPVLALLLFALIPAAGTGFPSKEFPALAAGSLPEGARVFAPDKFGGYLIYRFEGTRKVFFDGRSDFYGLDFMKEYVRMVETRPGWPALFDRWRFSHALLAKDAPLRSALELRGWRKAVEDDAAILLEAPGDRTWTGKR
jgi:hypothetical protein